MRGDRRDRVERRSAIHVSVATHPFRLLGFQAACRCASASLSRCGNGHGLFHDLGLIDVSNNDGDLVIHVAADHLALPATPQH